MFINKALSIIALYLLSFTILASGGGEGVNEGDQGRGSDGEGNNYKSADNIVRFSIYSDGGEKNKVFFAFDGEGVFDVIEKKVEKTPLCNDETIKASFDVIQPIIFKGINDYESWAKRVTRKLGVEKISDVSSYPKIHPHYIIDGPHINANYEEFFIALNEEKIFYGYINGICGEVIGTISIDQFNQEVEGQLRGMKRSFDETNGQFISVFNNLTYVETIQKLNDKDFLSSRNNIMTHLVEKNGFVNIFNSGSRFKNAYHSIQKLSPLLKETGGNSQNLFDLGGFNKLVDFMTLSSSEFHKKTFYQSEIGKKVKEARQKLAGTIIWNKLRDEIQDLWIQEGFEKLIEYQEFRNLKEEFQL